MIVRTARHARTLVTAFTLGSVALLAGCAGSDDDVHGRVSVESLGRLGQALSAGSVTAIHGTYGAGCDGRTEGEEWSVGTQGNGGLAHPELSVRKNDSSCSLALTAIETGGATYAASSALTLATSFAESPAAFKDASEDPIDFFGNANISSTSFASDFTITVRVSANHNDAVSGEKQGDFATQSSTVVVANVPAPNYTVSLDSFDLITDADDVVDSTAGFVALSEGSVTGQTYAIHEGPLSAASTPEMVASAFGAATYSGALSSLDSLQIPAAEFELSGVDLTSDPAIRTIILRNAEGSTGIASYQLIRVSFAKP